MQGEQEMDLLGSIKSEHGQTSLEFGLVLMLVSTAMIAALLLLFGGVSGYYQSLSESLKAVL